MLVFSFAHVNNPILQVSSTHSRKDAKPKGELEELTNEGVNEVELKQRAEKRTQRFKKSQKILEKRFSFASFGCIARLCFAVIIRCLM